MSECGIQVCAFVCHPCNPSVAVCMPPRYPIRGCTSHVRALTVRQDGSAACYWPNGDIAVTVSPGP